MLHEKIGPTKTEQLYNVPHIAGLYYYLSLAIPVYGEVLDRTMKRENRAADARKVEACIAFIKDSLAQKTKPEVFVRELYAGRTRYFPESSLMMDNYNAGYVTNSHGNINPLRHTCNCMVSYYEKFGFDDSISEEQKLTELMAVYFHDSGKAANPKEEMHPVGSVLLHRPLAVVTADILRPAPEEAAEREKLHQLITFAVFFHDVAGNIDSQRLTLDEAIKLILPWNPTPEMWDSLARVQYSDMACIPNMKDIFRLSNIEKLEELRLAVTAIQSYDTEYVG